MADCFGIQNVMVE